MKKNKQGFITRSLHAKFPKGDAYNALHMPVYDGVAYEFESAEDIAETFAGKKVAHAYSRTSNPTVEYFEKKMKAVTEAHAVVALASGMAAISNVLISMVEPGANIVTSNQLFGHSYALLKQTLPSLGLEVRFVDMTDISAVEKATDEKTRVYFFETITNPQLEIVDLHALSQLAQAKGVAVVCDSTITPPYVFQSKQFGVDVEVMSTTKFISGGAAAFGGVVVDNGLFDYAKNPSLESWHDKYGKDALVARIRKEVFRHLGGTMTAHTAHFMNLGLDIMPLRIERCVDNCLRLGEFLEGHPQIKSYNYPGIVGNKGYDLAQKQFLGKPGAVMTFDLESKEACFKFYNRLQVMRKATNLNDNKTLIIHPESTIYAEFSSEEKQAMDVRPTMMRLSVGIEDVEDLIEDFTQALQF
ncbi:aminotransferase class V-fold PLP-dependent enzyme [Carboxylicivirga sp. M1479]|uniref:aminotransferase class V-fold PLP-dependent enzyme n=1 Tax=Carboxylicivirga sp. M1479 TaxID=2594476 RepID=UPI001177974D|nr:aminotransferase class V-fold PLP-dependent enzyme [Carboxylicivirga sp. M1479]TRX65978.1 O-acetylhomoserine aminocarboxypropyltransferase/cysteine synthase [Carboxylicivirga sp. M1479]